MRWAAGRTEPQESKNLPVIFEVDFTNTARYFRVASDGSSTNRPLNDTHEYIHASARVRFVLRGPGKEDKGDWEPPALDDWKLVVEYPEESGEKPDVYWKAKFKSNNVSTRVLPEAPLWEYERQLLSMDQKMEEEVLRPPPTARRRR